MDRSPLPGVGARRDDVRVPHPPWPSGLVAQGTPSCFYSQRGSELWAPAGGSALSSRAGGLGRGSAEPRRRNQASPEGSAPAGCARAEGESAWESGGREAPAGRAGPRRLRSVRSDSRELGGRGGEEGMWNKENSWVRAMKAKVCRGVGGALM